MKKFENLMISENWNKYFKNYAHGHTVVEQLIHWMSQVNNLVENVNDWNEWLELFENKFDKNLLGSARKIIEEMIADGRFQEFLDEALTRINEIKEYVQKNKIYINVQDYGAIGDGVHDDAPAIREAIEVANAKGGGTVFFPRPKVEYALKSIIQTSDMKTAYFVINSGNVTLLGDGYGVKLSATVSANQVIYITDRINFLEMNNITIKGNNMVDYCFNTANVYVPYITIRNCRFEYAIKDQFVINTFMSLFEKATFAGGKRGLVLGDVNGGMCTSITLNSCYCLFNEEVGFYLYHGTYITFNSCGVDKIPNGIAYYINSCYGLSMNGCGAELCKQIFKGGSIRGGNINGMFGLEIGSLIEDTKPEYLVEFGSALDVTLSGFHFHNMSKYKYNYKLGLTISSYGYENITVTDNSFTKETSYYVTNWKFETTPILFLRGGSTKNETITINVDQLIDTLKRFNDSAINHTVTIKIRKGIDSVPTGDLRKFISRINGSGKLTIESESGNPNDVIISGGYNQIIVTNCSANITFKNITIKNTLGGNWSEQIIFRNSKGTIHNVVFDDGGVLTGSCVSVESGSNVWLSGSKYVGDRFRVPTFVDTLSTLTGTVTKAL